ncbi:AAA family ATPase [Phycicoccus duodecadis]|uniref:Shikimate kinase n=1 Tax=Phycicoccus duodecadis TaxID=173053 RepID=A0A2N3YK85_9MICO|nr:AAA family ATPase [Phycicoccus duodecadis]PKW27260.1 shikimate kinase [Phycicoccus duodecadis]
MSDAPAGTGRLLCVGGAPGAGKTTVGARVARVVGAALVDLDSVTTALVEAVAAGFGEDADLDAPRYAALREARYACLDAVVGDCLRAGSDVVAVAPFTREAADARAWRRGARARGAASVTLVWLDVDPAVAAARAAVRGFARDRAKAGRGAGRASASASAPVDRGGLDLVLDAAAGAPDELAARVLARWAPLV